MTGEEFVRLVSNMRFAQKLYFRSRSPDRLADAKKLEAKVDEAIKLITGTFKP